MTQGEDQAFDALAGELIKNVRDNILRPMHDSLNMETKAAVRGTGDELIRKLDEVMNKLNMAERRQNAFINALGNLKWEA